MAVEIIVALIGLGGSAIGAFVGVLTSTKMIDYRLSQLEKKVEKHNTLIDRTYKLEDSVHLLDERIKVANHRLDDLEKGVD